MFFLIYLLLTFYISLCNSYNFIQFTDIHLDLLYKAGSADNCLLHSTGMPCCRSKQISREPYSTVSKWGSYKCDTPKILLDESLEWVSNNIEDIDFIIFTGDSADHHVIFQSLQGNIEAINTVSDLFEKWFPKTRIINILGNHDTFPIDQTLPFIDKHIYKEINKKWKVPSTFEWGGFFKTEISNNLCILSINTLHFDSNNIFYNLETDYTGQLKWIEDEIKNCIYNNKSIWLLTHEKPSSNWYSKQYLDLIYKYKKYITNMFFGHSHRDQLVIFEKQNNPFIAGFLPPSFMPDGHDPTFRIYRYNGTHIQDYIQYSANLTQIIKNNKVSFKKTYAFKEKYGFSPVKENLLNLYHLLETNNTVLNEYCSSYYMVDKKCNFKELKNIISISN